MEPLLLLHWKPGVVGRRMWKQFGPRIVEWLGTSAKVGRKLYVCAAMRGWPGLLVFWECLSMVVMLLGCELGVWVRELAENGDLGLPFIRSPVMLKKKELSQSSPELPMHAQPILGSVARV